MNDQTGKQVSRLIGRLAGIAAVMIMLIPPLAYLLGDYQQLAGSLEADARTQAALVSQTINRNPGVWQFAHERLKGNLEEVRDLQRRTSIVNAKGDVIAEFPISLRPPVIQREALFFDFGAPAGVVRVEASLQTPLLYAALILAVSSAIGGFLFFPLRNIPVSALRRANEELIDSEQRNRIVVNGLREGVLLIETDLRVLAANPSASRILGVPEAKLIGADLSAIFDCIVVGADGASLAPEQWPISRALASGEPQEDVILGLQRPGIPEQWLRVNAQTVTHREGDFRYVVASFEDETETVRTRERLLLTDHAFQSTADAIFVADDNMNLLYLNRAFSTITGFAPEEWIGRKLRELADASLGAGLDELAGSVKERAWRGDFWGRRKDKQPFVAWLNVNAVHNAAGRLTHHVGSFSDVTERVRAEERVLHLAQHDVLTGLPNRTMLRESLALILAGAKRRGGEVGILFVDLDHFKSVNDTMGHAVGDQLLIEVARRLKENQRESDLVSRLAGDEFVIVLPDRSEALNMASVAEKIVKCLSDPYSLEGRQFALTPSIGISVFPADGSEVDELLSNADTAKYAAKENGRANFQFFSAAMNSGATARLEVTNAVRLALKRNEFVLHYQPQIEAHSGRLCGVEALIRWNHPERGLVSPGAFIPVVEGTRLIIDIGEWVLTEAARQVRAWYERSWVRVPIAVNVSPLHFRQVNFIAHLSGCIGSAGLPPGSIEIEITESLLVDNPDGTRLKMSTLKDMGFAISLDDFGTGYSSLAYLTHYPFDQLKIDQSFVRRITTDETTLNIVEAIITLAHAMHLVVLAEGVETIEEAALLRDRGCDHFQGYLFARPMPAAEMEAWLQAGCAPVGA